MIKLYIDFDGVILDTITYTANEMEFNKITTQTEINHYFQNINWSNLINVSPEINNGIENIKKINNSELFDVNILTHVNSNHEIEEKSKFLYQKLPDIKVIYVPVTVRKDQYVDSTNAVLIDDYIKNIISWEEHGGIGIKFSNTNKDGPYLRIKSLDEIFGLYEYLLSRIKGNKVKRRCKDGIEKY